MLLLNKIEHTDLNSPGLILDPRAYRKIVFWTQEAARKNREVSGLGVITARQEPHPHFYVSDVYLVKPTIVNSAHVEMDPIDGVVDTMQRHMALGRSMRSLRFLWHSHNNFGVGWSSDDDDTARNSFPAADWFVNLVTNQKGDYLARLDYPKEGKETVHRLPVFLNMEAKSNSQKEWETEYQEKHQHLKKAVPAGTRRVT